MKIYRQNQFQLEIDFVGGLASYSSDEDTLPYFVLQGKTLIPVQALYFHVSITCCLCYLIQMLISADIRDKVVENFATKPRRCHRDNTILWS